MIGAALGAAVALSLVIACSSFGEENGVPAPEAGAGGDGALDSTALADGPSIGCGASFALCDDFERSEPAGGRFGWIATNGGAFVSIDSNHARSPSRSLKLVVPASPDASSPSLRGYLTHNVAPSTRTFRVAFSVLAEADVPDVQLAMIGFDGLTNLFVDVLGGKVRMVEQQESGPKPQPFYVHESTQLVVGRWTRIELDVDVNAKKMTLHRDDVDTDLVVALKVTFPNTVAVRIGATFAESRMAPATFYYDDVGISAE